MTQSAPSPAPYRAPATRALIWATLGAFFLITFVKATGFHWVPSSYGAVPSRLQADFPGEAIKLFTSIFVHDEPTHLMGNLLFLYVFGRKIEEHLGPITFVIFFLLAGALGALSNYLVAPNNPIALIGGSGAISGLMGARLVLLPTEKRSFARLLLFGAIVIWFLINLFLSLVTLGNTTDTAFFAHLGGFTAGLILIRIFSARSEGDGTSNTASTPSERGEPYVADAPIFRKEEDGPFWRP